MQGRTISLHRWVRRHDDFPKITVSNPLDQWIDRQLVGADIVQWSNPSK